MFVKISQPHKKEVYECSHFTVDYVNYPETEDKSELNTLGLTIVLDDGKIIKYSFIIETDKGDIYIMNENGKTIDAYYIG